MLQLQLNDEETEVLLKVLKNHTANLDVEIHRVEHHWEFRKALEKEEKLLHGLIDRINPTQ